MVNIESALVEYTGNAQVIASQYGIVELSAGEVMVTTSDTTQVQSGDTTITVAPGTVALITREGGVVKVRNLHEQGAGSQSVAVAIDGQSISISSGHELIIGLDGDSVIQAMKADGVGRRLASNFEISGRKGLGSVKSR